MYVAEVWSVSQSGSRMVRRVEDARQDLFYAKVAGTVEGLTRAEYVVTSLHMVKEGE